MFKKLFKSLTQSDEARLLERMEGEAARLEVNGSPQIAQTLREFAKLKEDLDSRLEQNDSALLEIEGFADLAESICDAAISQAGEMAKMENSLPGILTSRNADRLTTYMDKWKRGNQTIMRGYAALHRAITGNGATSIEESSVDGEKTALDQAAESLLVEVRTAERIRNELGH